MSCKFEQIQKQSSRTYVDQTIKNGFMQVKLPISLRGIIGQWKAWSKKWIEIQFGDNHVDKSNISVNLFIFRSQKSGSNGLRNLIYQQNFQSQNAVIFRCRSRSQTYAFTICSIDNANQAIHLAGISESDCQKWMKCLRKSLWPPNPLMELENSLKGHFYVSIIDNENSHRSGLLGAYGYLQVSAKKLILTHPQTGHVIQEWHLSSFFLENPFEKILQIISLKFSSSGRGNIFFYCNDANEVIKRINREKEFIKYVKGYGVELEDRFSNISTSLPKSINNLRSFNLEPNIDNLTNKTSFSTKLANTNAIDCNIFHIRTAKEIPETMLNSSFSSPNSLLTNHIFNYKETENIYSEPFDSNEDFESEDMYEEIEKIYEEIIVKECDECLNSCNICHRNKKTKFEEDLPPELPPKKIISSNAIKMRYNSDLNETFSGVEKCKSQLGNEMNDNEIGSYDMFSTIVRQTHISLLNRQKLLNKSSNLASNTFESEDLKQELVNDYYEMRPISTKPIDINNKSNHSSLYNDYVDMKSFSI